MYTRIFNLNCVFLHQSLHPSGTKS